MKIFCTPHPANRRPTRQNTVLVVVCCLALALSGISLWVGTNPAHAAQGEGEPVFGGDTKTAPEWLQPPINTYQLYSEFDLPFLAGHLIAFGDVEASACPGGPFVNGGAASVCGMELARPAMEQWQNRFNGAILAASQETGVPPRLIKNIFAWESQFWPTTIYVNTYEYGFGHITEAGADSTLRWNYAFYQKLCRATYSAETCDRYYSDQPADIRAGLMGTVVNSVTADCAGCPYGLDLKKAVNSIPVFANTLLANANLVNLTVKGLTGKPAIESVSYQDLWKFTLTSYNAGPGCFRTAFGRTFGNYKKLNWQNFASQLDPACQGAVKYVEFISNTERYHPSDDPGLNPTPTTIDSATPEATGLPTETPTELPTLVASGTPQPTLQATATPTLESTTTSNQPTVTETPQATPSDAVNPLDAPHMDDQLVLKVNPAERQELQDLLQTLGIDLSKDGEYNQSLSTTLLKVDPAKLAEVLSALHNHQGVVYSEPNYLVSMASLPNDPRLNEQPNLWTIKVPQAWEALPKGHEVLVAVLDTGLDASHPDLAAVAWQNPGETGVDANGNDKRFNGIDDDGNGMVDDWQGWNFVAGNNTISDDQGHGTHIVGIIAATSNNGLGMAGIASNARILPVKVLDGNGYGSYTQVAEGIRYAADMGARIINLGFGGLGSSQMMQDAVNYALSKGVLLVAAAGNGGLNSTYYPAAYPGVVAVGSVDNVLNWSPFSSSGNHISLVAPGVGILSTWPGGSYQEESGTSMASAHVSGVAALLAGQAGFESTEKIRSALLGSAVDLGQPGRDPYFGYGLVHAMDALTYYGPLLPTPTPWMVPTSTGGGGVVMQAITQPGSWTLAFTGAANSATYSYSAATGSNRLLMVGIMSTHASNVTINSPTVSFGGTALTLARGDYTTSMRQHASFYYLPQASIPSGAQTLSVNLGVSTQQLGLWVATFDGIDQSVPIDSSQAASRSTNGSTAVFGTALTINAGTQAILLTNIYNLSGTTGITFGTDPPTNWATASGTYGGTTTNAWQFRLNNYATIPGTNTSSTASHGTLSPSTLGFSMIGISLSPVITPTPTYGPVMTATLPSTRPVTATPQVVEPHHNYTTTTEKCAACHRAHSAQSEYFRSLSTEEGVCYACHTSGGSGTNVQPAFTTNTNTSTRIFSHAVSGTLNVHLADENTGAAFGGAFRHVECEDCHEPHLTGRSTTPSSLLPPSIQQVMFGASGVDPSWSGVGTPTAYTWLSTANRESQVCFKCHSSYTTLPTYVPDGWGYLTSNTQGYLTNGLPKLTSTNAQQVKDSRDIAREFNPYLKSFHPVMARGRNTAIPNAAFVAPWTATSTVYCSDCHTNAAAPTNGVGPHGSPRLHILDGSYNYITVATFSSSGGSSIHNTGELCFNCHQAGLYNSNTISATNTGFHSGTSNYHQFHNFASCYTCHDTHGSEQDHLINFDTSSNLTIDTGYTSQTAWVWSGTTGTCYITCHGASHGTGKQYTP